MIELTTRLLALAIFSLLAHAQTTGLYYIAFLRPAAERRPLSPADTERIQSAHMANIRGMAERGVLVAAGPFGDTPTTISGIFVMNAASLDEARRIAGEDPTVLEHRNTVDVVGWRGPAGIGVEYVRLHKANPATPEDMGIQPFFMLHRGPKWDTAAQQAHETYIDGLRKGGKLGAAGAVESGGTVTAILIFNRMSDDEAKRLVDEDPAVKSLALRAEYHRWWSAAHVLPRGEHARGH
jgi:uncharacterized protein YciI